MGAALDVLGPLAFWCALAGAILSAARQDDARTARLLAISRAARLRRSNY